MSSTPLQRVHAYFEGDAADLAVTALRSYYAEADGSPHWTGSAFDRLASTSDPNRFTAQDMLAVSMLSVTVPPRAALWLTENELANHMLARLPAGVTLWESPQSLDRDSKAWNVWKVVDDLAGVGATIASKILAAKRAALIPVFDQHVDRALQFGVSHWAFWQSVARDDHASALLASVEQAMTEARVPSYVSPLRSIDVVIWMREHGWTTHESAKCQIGCDFSSF